ncbi:phenylacetate-CoA ligase [Polynucleobacter sphagniphilus]|uniref:phenylacetate--CoA ligase family protein n=1 Tax=Polynucleobacter sphagniphilus TaxID=1743169 RepID=UPI00247341B0|nr:phenylacetate--CoA ligase family protein [Polynucleobacter sphagniphilus]MDH6420914.1 phenylacetate-CoA ligase [Polynucleobacter sphagniphilus]
MNRSIQYMQGLFSAFIAYPIAEHLERRDIRSKRAELREYYRLDFDLRKRIMRQRLVDIVAHAGACVPYYKDLFRSEGFDPEKLRQDPAYLQDLPYLTKDIIREQGRRMLSKDLDGLRYHDMKTGGSTGLSAHFFYDQPAADYAAAVTLYGRERVGKKKHHSELHFACRFPDAAPSTKWTREDWKCLAMNRSNIFFGRLDTQGLEEMWDALSKRRPHLIHGHPSTIYALACHIEATRGGAKVFEIFESSGELLEEHQREVIRRALGCQVINRYGLAELGVMAYELNGPKKGFQVLDSEGWPESMPVIVEGEKDHELVFTGFRNRLMPLLRYRTGDMASVNEESEGYFLSNVVGRIHDLIPINGIPYPTHHIMDILDHRVGGIQEFQIDLRQEKPILRIVPEVHATPAEIQEKIQSHWTNAFEFEFVEHDSFVRVGRHQKFRHLVHP